MKRGTRPELCAMIYEILLLHSDEEHIISMPDLQSYLSEDGIDTDRRTVYHAIKALNKHQRNIEFVRNGREQGYYLVHPFSKTDIFFLIDAVQQSLAMSKTESKRLSDKLLDLLSEEERKQVSTTISYPGKTENNSVLRDIDSLLPAISGCHIINFQYYDFDPNKKKNYRISKETGANNYQGVPYGIFSNQGRFYLILYIAEIKDFHTFRIDKIDHLKISEEQENRVSFSINDHVRNSFQGYAGKAQTITLECDINRSNQLFDQFGKQNVIVSSVGKKKFVASIKAVDTPTMKAWLLQFYDSIKILKPQSLINELFDMSSYIQKTYKPKKEG